MLSLKGKSKGKPSRYVLFREAGNKGSPTDSTTNGSKSKLLFVRRDLRFDLLPKLRVKDSLELGREIGEKMRGCEDLEEKSIS